MIYNIPIVVHLTNGTISVDEILGEMKFSVSSPEQWSYAKISVLNHDNSIIDTTSVTPDKDSKITVYEPGQYWIESNIRVGDETINAYEIVKVASTQDKKGFDPLGSFDIQEKPMLIVFAVIVIIALVGLKIRN